MKFRGDVRRVREDCRCGRTQGTEDAAGDSDQTGGQVKRTVYVLGRLNKRKS